MIAGNGEEAPRSILGFETVPAELSNEGRSEEAYDRDEDGRGESSGDEHQATFLRSGSRFSATRIPSTSAMTLDQ